MEPPAKHKKSKERSDVAGAKETPEEIISRMIASGETTIMEWEHALKTVRDQQNLDSATTSIVAAFPGPFKGSSIEKVASSAVLVSLEQTEGDDWRYDKTRASSTWTFQLKDHLITANVQLAYAGDDGIDITVNLTQDKSSVAHHLVDCSSTKYPHDFWEFLWVEEADVTAWLRKINVIRKDPPSARNVRLAKAMCWFINTLIAYTSPAAAKLEDAAVVTKITAELAKLEQHE